MSHPLVSNLLQSWPLGLWQDQSIVLAVSGGADSVALLRAVCEVRSHLRHSDRLHVAHLNHGWRGTESDWDEQFVVELSHTLGIACTVHRLPPQPESAKSEQAARKARHAFFKQVAHERNARFVATAHTASDRVETMLHNLCRGTGLSGVLADTLATFGQERDVSSPADRQLSRRSDRLLSQPFSSVSRRYFQFRSSVST